MPILLALLLLVETARPAPAEVRHLTFTVSDDKGVPVEGLGAEEVVVLENGVAREVTQLELDRRPLAVAVLVDSSEPMAGIYRLQLVDPVLQFLGRLPEGSHYALWTTGDRPTKRLDFTADPTLASRALQRVIPQGGNTVLDTVVEASRDLGHQEGRRAVVVVVTGSGIGFLNRDRRQVVEESLKSGATFLAVQFDEGRRPLGAREEQGAMDPADYDYVLANLTERSGGRRETLLSAMGVASALRKMGADLKGRYRLSYRPLPGVKDPKIEVQVARAEAKVRLVRTRR